ncbi:MAG: septum formation family protein [Euzebya sp.]
MNLSRPLIFVLVPLTWLLMACSPQALAFTIGECVNVPDGNEINEYETVDCAQAHDSEVFALPQRPEGADDAYPGQEALQTFAAERCQSEFESYVGTPYEQSAFYYTVLVPSQDSWDQAEDREIVCLLVGDLQDDGTFSQLEGPKAGSGE